MNFKGCHPKLHRIHWPSMRLLLDLIRRNLGFFLLATAAALGLRLTFVFFFPHLAGDTFVYGDIAKTWLNHGVFGFTGASGVRPTLIRLPGYPAFLAAVFSVAGQDHYGAVMMLQAVIDTGTCLVVCALALELMNERAAKAAYLLSALCPFTANYTAAPLTETLAICCAAHTLYYGVRGLRGLNQGRLETLLWLCCGLWTAAGAYMRPDGVMLLAPLGAVLLFYLVRRPGKRLTLVAGTLLLFTSLLPLAPWTVRNWKTFHVLEPLAPRYANDPGEFVPAGFNHWVRTWLADFVSVEEIYWPVTGDALPAGKLPQRAFDSPSEYEQTMTVIAHYNDQLDIDHSLDQEFEQLARQRVARHPVRYYLWLPFLRISSMWLRPRIEMLPVEPRWWEFSEHPSESMLAAALAGFNLALLAAAVIGWKRWDLGVYGVVLVGFVLLRSSFLGGLENPEPRYVLECYPVLLMYAGGGLARRKEPEVGEPSIAQ